MMQSSFLEKWTTWVLLVVAIGLVWFAELRPRRWETCANVDQLTDVRGLPRTKNVQTEVRQRSNEFLFDWRRGDLNATAGQLNFHIMRSVEPINHGLNAYHKLKWPYQPTKTWVEERDISGEKIPIQWSYQPIGEKGSSFYLARLDYLGARPIRSTFWNLILSAPSQLIHGSLPVTTYMVEAAANAGEEVIAQEEASEWVEAVARRNREACAE